MASTFTVTNQQQTQDISASGQVADAMRVFFKTTPGGVEGDITVPLDQFTAQNVNDLITARVAVIDAVAAL